MSHHQPRTTWHQSPCFCGTALHIAWKVFPAIIKAKQMATSITLIQTLEGKSLYVFLIVVTLLLIIRAEPAITFLIITMQTESPQNCVHSPTCNKL